MSTVTRLLPHGKYTLGYLPKEKISEPDRFYQNRMNGDYESFMIKNPLTGQEEFSNYYVGDTPSARLRAETLGLSILSNSHKLENDDTELSKSASAPDRSAKQKRHGLNGITRRGRDAVKSGVALLQKKYGKKRLAMLTCTLPSVTPYHMLILTAYWGEVLRRFFQELTRELKRKGAPDNVVSVTEIQTKRAHTYGECGLHIHCIYVAHDGKNYRKQGKKGSYMYYISADKFRRMWKNALENVLEWATGEKLEYELDCSAAIDTSTIKKDAIGYIGKYISKGTKTLEELRKTVEDLDDQLPRQWWYVTKVLKSAIKAYTIQLPFEIVQAIKLGENLIESGFAWMQEKVLIVMNDGNETCVGYWGYLTNDGYNYCMNAYKRPIADIQY